MSMSGQHGPGFLFCTENPGNSPLSRQLLEDSRDSQVVGVLPMSTPCCGIADPRGQAGLIEQTARLVNDVVEVVIDQHFLAHIKQFGNRGAELGKNRRAAASGLE